MKTNFYSNGKLLITGEYLVLDGATALAVPTGFGQSMQIEKTEVSSIIWTSYNSENEIWFKGRFVITNQGEIKSLSTGPLDDSTKILIKILSTAKNLNPKFLSSDSGYTVETHLDFPNAWGLGTSSTLINNIALWANVNAFVLLQMSFGGSGYDIACAHTNSALYYNRNKNKAPTITPTTINWPFKDQVYFVYLNQKMDSKKGIAHYKEQAEVSQHLVDQISKLSSQFAKADTIEDFELLIAQHERLLSKILRIPTIKQQLFKDYPRAIKSLGAWGGDFVMVTANQDQLSYFKDKGFTTILSYDQMILE